MTFPCEIVFHRNPTKVFYSGQNLRGYVHLSLKSEQDIRSIHVYLNGIVLASWEIGRAFRRCKEDCLSLQNCIIGNLNDKNTMMSYQFTSQNIGVCI